MEPPSTRSVCVLNESGLELPVSEIERAVDMSLAMQGITAGDVSVLLTDDGGIQALNFRFRALNEPTDVLTFVSCDPMNLGSLGDIAISVPYAKKQATLRGVCLDQELAFLAIHGALHLAGFDDESESDRAQMVAEMNRVAIKAGFMPDLEWASILHEHSENDLYGVSA